MEEELNYVTPTFRQHGVSAFEKPNKQEIIYDEVKTDVGTPQTNPVTTENKKKAPAFSLPHLLAAGLGILCVVLLSVIVTLTVHLKAVVSEQCRENRNSTAQNQPLRTERSDLQRQTEALTRERDGLKWTIEVILEYDNFPVKTQCPQKVCRPCLEGWMLFRSSCYQFSESNFSSHWKTWTESRDECRSMKAALVTIQSPEEQEFINNHTKAYQDKRHGYWMGLRRKDLKSSWMWEDGSNLTVTYWREKGRGLCALAMPEAHGLASWQPTGGDMKNRWICEQRALIKSHEESAAESKNII